MSAIDTLRAALYGNPPTAGFQPDRVGVINAFATVVTSIETVVGGIAGAAATAVYASRSTLFANLAYVDRSLGLVYNDATASFNGIYIKSGASGSGSWVATGLLATGPTGPMGPSISQAEIENVLEAYISSLDMLVSQAEAARDDARTAAGGSAAGGNYFISRTAGEAGTAVGLAFSTKDVGNNYKVYERTVGGSIELNFGPYVNLAGAQTVSGKTFAGAFNAPTNGNVFSITNENAAREGGGAVLNVYNNGNATTGIRLISLWEGSTAVPLVNNDTSLFNTFTKTVSPSDNFTWTISAPNCYNWIPAGVRDGGERVAVYGWATSVQSGSYRHSGTLFRQIGGRFTSGFQGLGSASGAVIEEAFCVDARLIRETPGTTIQHGYGVVVRSEPVDGGGDGTLVENYIGVHVRHGPGFSSNYCFRAEDEAGPMYVGDVIESGNAVIGTSFKIGASEAIDVDGNYFRYYRKGGNVGYYGGTVENVFANTTHRFSSTGDATAFIKIDVSGIDIQNGALKVAGAQVVGTRKIGWAADTGTARRAANATYGAGTTLTFGATYTQSELTAMATRLAAIETALQNLAQTSKAIKDDLTLHGLLGA